MVFRLWLGAQLAEGLQDGLHQLLLAQLLGLELCQPIHNLHSPQTAADRAMGQQVRIHKCTCPAPYPHPYPWPDRDMCCTTRLVALDSKSTCDAAPFTAKIECHLSNNMSVLPPSAFSRIQASLQQLSPVLTTKPPVSRMKHHPTWVLSSCNSISPCMRTPFALACKPTQKQGQQTEKTKCLSMSVHANHVDCSTAASRS